MLLGKTFEEDLYLKFDKALRKNETKDYIRGTNGYMGESTHPQGIIIEGESNYYDAVYKEGFVKFNSEYPHYQVGKLLLSDLKEMLDSSSPYDLYCCARMAEEMIRNDVKKDLNISSDELETFLTKLKTTLNDRKDELMDAKRSDNVPFYKLIELYDKYLNQETNKHIL